MRDKMRKWREENSRNSEQIVEVGEELINEYASKLGDDIWIIYEQVMIAALDYGRDDLALFCLQELRRQFPGSHRVKRLTGMRFEAMERYDDAIQLYDRILQEDPTNTRCVTQSPFILRSQREAGPTLPPVPTKLLHGNSGQGRHLGHSYFKSVIEDPIKLLSEILPSIKLQLSTKQSINMRKMVKGGMTELKKMMMIMKEGNIDQTRLEKMRTLAYFAGKIVKEMQNQKVKKADLLETKKPGMNLQNFISMNMSKLLNTFNILLSAVFITAGIFCYAKAAFCLEELMMINPHNHLYCQQYAEVKYTQGGLENLELSRKYFAQALKLNNRNMRALFGLYMSASHIASNPKASAKTKKDNMKYATWAASQINRAYQVSQEIEKKEEKPKKNSNMTSLDSQSFLELRTECDSERFSGFSSLFNSRALKILNSEIVINFAGRSKKETKYSLKAVEDMLETLQITQS
ncbi:hypothetical protein P7K49_026815 [Saguinus oedipus]|uniref:ER membrane protein complex subunit 2 n=1 Tax=Saguinus oedipus TaxID=9490 RepID=A0ABQ9UE89_SAGOE|nr:hypothetical protein P7K49_026815 [Saguinus oedipus]